MSTRFILGILVAAVLAAACGSVGVSGVPRRPGYIEKVGVSNTAVRGEYLEATLGLADGPIRFYFPNDATCRGVVVDGSTVEYQLSGPRGQVLGAEKPCEPTGTSSLVTWRKRRPPVRWNSKDRKIVRFRQVGADSGQLMLRGDFWLVSYLGFVSDDVVVFVSSRDVTCKRIAERGEAFLEFRARAEPVLTLLQEGARCEIVGVTQPIRGSGSGR